jgi:hypothetical protein
VWVVGSGDASRRAQTAQKFRELKVCAIGPARTWEDVVAGIREQEAKAGKKLGSREPGMIARFSKEGEGQARPGNIVVLRGGLREVVDVGVLGPYAFDEGLGVAAWDLGHVRSTEWLCIDDEERERLTGLLEKRLPQLRFARLSYEQERLRRAVQELVETKGTEQPTWKPEPTERLGVCEFCMKVRERCSGGDRIDIDRLVEAVENADSFGSGRHDYHRLEADTMAMVVVPLLGALGTDLRHVRVEVPIRKLGADPAGRARRIDAVVFEAGNIDKPILLVEAKRRWGGLDPARRQMVEYLDQIEQPGMANLITDGSEFEIEHIEGLPGEATSLKVSLFFRTDEGATALARLSDHLSGYSATEDP